MAKIHRLQLNLVTRQVATWTLKKWFCSLQTVSETLEP